MVDMVATTLFVDERWMVEPPFARAGGGAFGENPAYWSVEFYVTCFDRLNHMSPGDSDVSQLTEGKIIGLDIWVFDVDENPGQRAEYYLDRPGGSEPHDGHDASTLLDGVLLGPGGSGDSAVQSVSWGRIKHPWNRSSQRRFTARQELNLLAWRKIRCDWFAGGKRSGFEAGVAAGPELPGFERRQARPPSPGEEAGADAVGRCG